jgi:RimJ/RimL family protein N-acetyltransferase
MSPEQLDWLWTQYATQDYMFTDWDRTAGFDGFLSRLFDPSHLYLAIDHDGLCVLFNAWANDAPEVHFCIWNDRRSFRATLEAAREVVAFVFERLKAVRLTAQFPAFHQDSVKLATLLGFRFEGELRRACLWHGQHYNVTIMGLLKEDWLAKKGAANGRHDIQ